MITFYRRTTLILLAGFFLTPAHSASASSQNSAENRADAEQAQVSRSESVDSGTGRTLEDFFTAAMEYSPTLQMAREQMDIGAARKRARTGAMLPQVSATASVTDNRRETFEGVTTYRGERYALQLRQILFDWATFARRSQASLEEDQYEAEYYAELGQLLTDVAERYLDVLEAEDAYTSSEAELEAVQSQLSQVERLHGLQMVQITDLYEAQARASSVEAERLNLGAEVAIAREALRSATGLAVGDLYVLDADAELPVAEGTVDDWVERAQRQSHQIRAAEYALDAANKRVSERRGAYLPRVSLIAQQQRADLGFDNVPTPRTDTTYVGIDVTIPLFAGGTNRATVREFIGLENIARHELRQINLDVSDQTRMSYLQLNSNRMRIEAAERVLESAAISAQSRQRGFELGAVTNADVLDAVQLRFIAERDLQRVRYEQLRLGLYLRRDAGTLSPEDLMNISRLLQTPE